MSNFPIRQDERQNGGQSILREMNSPKHTVSTGSIIIAAKDQVSTDLDGETVILNLESGTYYSLDPVGTRIWSLIQESKTVGEIRDTILEEYEVEPDRCEQDIIALIEQLVDTGLVEVRDETAA